MTQTLYKLVPVTANEIDDKEARVLVVTDTNQLPAVVSIMNSFKPDFVLNVIEGSVGIFNFRELIDRTNEIHDEQSRLDVERDVE